MKKLQILKRKPMKNKKLARFVVLPSIILVLIGLGAFLYFFLLKDIPTTAIVGLRNFPQSTKIYDRNGTLLYTIYGNRNQTFVPFDKLPKNLKNATIAIEDKNFYNHGAVDLRGIARAVFENITNREVSQGGSTLTQQLVRSSLLTQERTFTRKIKEILLSFIVEAMYSKNQILEMYLNQVAYGGTAWGAQAASQVYFGKPVTKLSLAESAFIAGLPQAPSVYSPFGSHPEEGKARQEEVLSRMKDQGYITASQQKKAVQEPLVFSEIRDKIYAPHFVFYVKDLLIEKYGIEKVEQGGLSVTTTLDLDLQEFAQASLSAAIDESGRYNISNGAALVTNPATGEILSMVGSRDYFDSDNDGNVNVTLARRQPGSSIKPINYATGLAKGYTAATPFVDEKTCFNNINQPDYCPVNYDGKFHGVQQMRPSLGNSYNIPAVKMLKLNGVDAMIATASAMGITTFTEPERYGLSLTLGGGEVTMLNMAEAFGVFANGGYKVPLHAVLKVTDSRGKVLEEYEPPANAIFGKKVMDPGIAFIISHILQDNGARTAAFGPNSVLRVGKYPVSVKTGTTNDYRDNWTVGYTPSFVAVVWVGNNDNTPMSGIVSGVTGAAPIWNDIMTHLVAQKPPESLKQPNDVVGLSVCSDSGLLPPPADKGSCPTRFEYFLRGTQPNKADLGIQKVFVDKNTQDLPAKGQTENLEEKDHRVITDPTGDRYCVTCPHPDPNATPTPNP